MLVKFFSPHFGVLARPSISEMLQAKDHAPTHFPSIVFTFGLIIESIKELGGASNLDLIIGMPCVMPTLEVV